MRVCGGCRGDGIKATARSVEFPAAFSLYRKSKKEKEKILIYIIMYIRVTFLLFVHQLNRKGCPTK